MHVYYTKFGKKKRKGRRGREREGEGEGGKEERKKKGETLMQGFKSGSMNP